LDAILRDPQHPARLNAEADSGDHIHPNDAGHQKMADAFDLSVFKL
jgi:lysophospholipase L1-like esterase